MSNISLQAEQNHGAGSVTFQESRRERGVDAAIHGAGVILGVAASVALAITALPHEHPRALTTLALYLFGLMSMLICSAVYNMTRNGPHSDLFRRLDHAAVYLMIAGTYSPLALMVVGGGRGLALFVFVWVVAISGAALKILFPRRFEGFSIAAYLLLGWTVVTVIGPLREALPLADLALLASGCVLYSVGVLFHLWTRLRYHNAIWHGFVLAAAACHYAVILAVSAGYTP